MRIQRVADSLQVFYLTADMTGEARVRALTLATILVAVAACEEKSHSEAKPATSAKADAGTPRSAGVDKNIAEAVAEVAGGKGPGASGPPASGVFTPGAADKEIRAGDPPMLALGGKGEGATVAFAGGAPKKKLDAKVVVSVQMGPRSAMPTVELSVTQEANAAAESGGDKPAAPTEMTLRVAGSKLASEQPGELPAGLEKEIGKLKGSKYHFVVGTNGAGRLAGIDIPKEADPGLATILETAGDTLSLALLPYPTEPVGAGAFWMIKTRGAMFGLETVSYRMMKLQRVENDRATISVNTKHYVVSGRLGFPGLPPHKIGEFNQTGNGTIVVPVAQPSSIQGENTEALLASLVSDGQGGGGQAIPPGQQLPIHFELRTKMVAP
jgi:hypothetical protein